MLDTAVMLITGLALLAYWYYHSIYGFWKKKGIPGPSPVPLVGNIIEAILKIKNIGFIYEDIYYKYYDQDAVGFYEFQSPKLMVKNPRLINRVLISDFSSFHDNEITATEKYNPFLESNSFVQRGEKWKPSRSLVISGMTTNRMKDIYLLMKQSIPLLDKYVDDLDGKDIEVKDFSNLFTMTNVSNSVFGIVNNCFTNPDSAFRKMVNLLHKEHWSQWWEVLMVFYLPRVRDFLGYRFLPEKCTKFVEDLVTDVAEKRLKNKIKRNDFFQYYLDQNKPDKEKIHELINHGVLFFIAGMETSSLVISNTLYELALNPEIQEQLYQELEDAYSDKSELDYDTLTKLPYLDKVFKESMRKYPILYSYMKLCTTTTTLEIDGKTVTIDAGTKVMVPVYPIHRDPQYYPDPDVFDPERFSKEGELSRPDNTYMPFGDGPRICTGKRFGVVQNKLFLANIVYKYKILPSDRTPSKLSYNNHGFFLTPSEDIWLRFLRRK